MRRLRKLVLSSIVALCAFAVVAFASVYAFAVEPPSSTSVNDPSSVTLTVHFSSFEGDDLVDPIVISGLTSGTTIDGALEGAGKHLGGELFELTGFYDSWLRTYRPAQTYTNWEEVWGGQAYSEDAINADTDIYVFMLKIIDAVDIRAVAPICGYKTDTQLRYGEEWVLNTQTNKPVFSVAGKGCHADIEDYRGSSNWITDDEDTPFVGTFDGNETYKAVFRLAAGFGYAFRHDVGLSYVPVPYTGTVTVNGQPAEAFYWGSSAIFVNAAVHAEHDWDEGTVTKEPTTEAEGERTFKCKNYDTCHGIMTESIAKLPKPEPASQNDEAKPAAAVTNETKGKPKKPGKKATTPKTSDAFDPNLCVSLATYSIAALGGAAAIRKRGWN